MKKPQIVVIIAVLAIVGYLYMQPVKGLQKAEEANHSDTEAATPAAPGMASTISVEQVSESAKSTIGADLAAPITDLEGKLKAASGTEKTAIEKQLATKWDDVNQPGPAAFYYKAVAENEKTADAWITAGNHFNDAYKLTQDTLVQPTFLTNAVQSFEQARQLAPDNLDAKTGLGIAYVNGGAPSPMAGISLLLEVVKQDPTNRSANLNLGVFSMKSGQFEKAVERFKTVIAQKPEVEPYFYLAESYKQLGRKKEAIEAYNKCKTMMPDPAFGQRIDEYIKELN
ncbi:tetratricopeptide repeat protein [Mucilaginibacter sp. JRF]|uniref:tetratricopeptide repeat protein n=1 Tax=Mucilaginibacter sp. JRF TaxID=2780088 RepID=UPI0018806E58|nr:tetratricopeptide repeat protein [Mucilaginibacter sp. JRF]MBE9585013.1 tetratricopeptide repeat protein [Mucilaginibacter sp. JRF]